MYIEKSVEGESKGGACKRHTRATARASSKAQGAGAGASAGSKQHMQRAAEGREEGGRREGALTEYVNSCASALAHMARVGAVLANHGWCNPLWQHEKPVVCKNEQGGSAVQQGVMWADEGTLDTWLQQDRSVIGSARDQLMMECMGRQWHLWEQACVCVCMCVCVHVRCCVAQQPLTLSGPQAWAACGSSGRPRAA